MTIVKLTLDIHEDYEDPNDSTGLTEAAYDEFVNAVLQFGDIIDGPTLDK